MTGGAQGGRGDGMGQVRGGGRRQRRRGGGGRKIAPLPYQPEPPAPPSGPRGGRGREAGGGGQGRRGEPRGAARRGAARAGLRRGAAEEEGGALVPPGQADAVGEVDVVEPAPGLVPEELEGDRVRDGQGLAPGRAEADGPFLEGEVQAGALRLRPGSQLQRQRPVQRLHSLIAPPLLPVLRPPGQRHGLRDPHARKRRHGSLDGRRRGRRGTRRSRSAGGRLEQGLQPWGGAVDALPQRRRERELGLGDVDELPLPLDGRQARVLLQVRFPEAPAVRFEGLDRRLQRGLLLPLRRGRQLPAGQHQLLRGPHAPPTATPPLSPPPPPRLSGGADRGGRKVTAPLP